MKKSLLPYALILFCFVLPVVLVSCNKDKEDIKLDFDITVPTNWTYFASANEGWVYTASRIPTSTFDTLRESLYVFKEKLPGYTLQSYYTQLRPVIMNLKTYGNLLYESDTVINTTSFKKLVSKETLWVIDRATEDTSSFSIITNRYVFFENDHGYHMIFLSDSALYESTNKSLFNEIMGTFHYKNN